MQTARKLASIVTIHLPLSIFSKSCPEYVSVTLLESGGQSGRSKRETGGCFDERMTFTFPVDGVDLELELSENTNLDMNKAVYVNEGGQITVVHVPPFLVSTPWIGCVPSTAIRF